MLKKIWRNYIFLIRRITSEMLEKWKQHYGESVDWLKNIEIKVGIIYFMRVFNVH